MIRPGILRAICAILAATIASPYLAGQDTTTPAQTQPAGAVQGRLNITVLEGDKSINSISLLHSTAAVVEIRDENDFPVEGATVIFTLPSGGSAGTFNQSGLSYTAKSDVSGQAAAPPVVPKSPGKFEITVTATLGNRKGQAVCTQTNSTGAYSGAALPGRPWYKRRLVWIIGGAAIATVAVVVVLETSSGPSSVSVTTGAPVFH